MIASCYHFFIGQSLYPSNGFSSFNAEKGIRLATYAARCIDNEILMHFRATKKNNNDISINEPIDTDRDGNDLTLIDVIADDKNIVEEIDTKRSSGNISCEKLSR